MTNPRYRILLRTLYSAVLASRLTPSEIKALAEELRRGMLGDELAFMLDQSGRHFSGDHNENSVSDNVSSILDLVKQRKLTKGAIFNIMKSLGAMPDPNAKTIRTMVVDFVESSTASRIDKLKDIIESSGDSDNFLTGIGNRSTHG